MNLLLDLDGTLTDPGRGISRCLQHALSALGAPVPPPHELGWCVGPPLRGTFATLLGTSDPGRAELEAAGADMFVESVEERGWWAGRPDRAGTHEH